MVLGIPHNGMVLANDPLDEPEPTVEAPLHTPAYTLGRKAGMVYIGAYEALAGRAELNAAQIAFEIARVVIAGPLGKELVED